MLCSKRNQGRRLVRGLVLLAALAGSGCGDGAALPRDDPAKQTLRLTSSAFVEGGKVPRVFTCDGVDRSPPLEWSGVPGTARALALICDDPDAPMGTWSHWVVFNLPPETTSLPEGASASSAALVAHQGKNDFGNAGYGGPCPPSGTHHYVFRLYALDAALKLEGTPTRATVLRALDGHIVAAGRLMGTYSR